MPPPGKQQPDAATHPLLRALDGEHAGQRRPQPSAEPGRVALHRLNRKEYANAVWDLLAVSVDRQHRAARRTTSSTASTTSPTCCRCRRRSSISTWRRRARSRSRRSARLPASRCGTQYTVKNAGNAGVLRGRPAARHARRHAGRRTTSRRTASTSSTSATWRWPSGCTTWSSSNHAHRHARRQEVLGDRHRWRGGHEVHRPEAGSGGRRHQQAPQGHPLQGDGGPAQGGRDLRAPHLRGVGRQAVLSRSGRRPGSRAARRPTSR